MSEQDIVSTIKRDYVFRLGREGKRYDGRAMDEYRPMEIKTGVVGQAEGSARVSIGETRVYVGVKMAPGEPYPDQPDQGILTTSAELIPMASPTFEAGPPKPQAIELARVVDRGIRETQTIDLDSLCIVPGEKVWVTYIDVHVVDYDGNLFDAASLGAMAALLDAKVPQKRFDLGEDYPLPVSHVPIMTTGIKLGSDGVVALDPALIEDQCGGPRLSVSTDEKGDIRAMQKGMEGSFTREEIRWILTNGRRRAQEIREALLKATGATVPRPPPAKD